jgi:hypothetical protein
VPQSFQQAGLRSLCLYWCRCCLMDHSACFPTVPPTTQLKHHVFRENLEFSCRNPPERQHLCPSLQGVQVVGPSLHHLPPFPVGAPSGCRPGRSGPARHGPTGARSSPAGSPALRPGRCGPSPGSRARTFHPSPIAHPPQGRQNGVVAHGPPVAPRPWEDVAPGRRSGREAPAGWPRPGWPGARYVGVLGLHPVRRDVAPGPPRPGRFPPIPPCRSSPGRTKTSGARRRAQATVTKVAVIAVQGPQNLCRPGLGFGHGREGAHPSRGGGNAHLSGLARWGPVPPVPSPRHTGKPARSFAGRGGRFPKRPPVLRSAAPSASSSGAVTSAMGLPTQPGEDIPLEAAGGCAPRGVRIPNVGGHLRSTTRGPPLQSCSPPGSAHPNSACSPASFGVRGAVSVSGLGLILPG